MKELLETGISTDLGYSGRCDALFGKVKDLSVVIKENNATKSYGVLIWVKKKNSTSDDELYSYLSEQVAAKPHIIKHFKTTGRGAALALVKYNDPVRNINNINRFLGDLADDLYAHDYVNCCYACGKTDDLAIYESGGAVVQYCSGCANGTKIKVGDEPVKQEAPAVYETPVESAATETAQEIEEEQSGSLEDILAELTDIAGEYGGGDEAADTGSVINGSDDISDLSDFMVDESAAPAEEPAPAATLIDEYAQRETVTDSSLDSFMFSEEDAAKSAASEPAFGTASEPAFGDANTYIDEDSSEGAPANLDGLMYDENDSYDDDADIYEDAEEEAAENANIYNLMVGSEQEIAEAGDSEVKVLATTEIGKGHDLQVAVQEEEEVGGLGGIQVTEIVDDSNEGEDFQIEALSSDFNMPTDTKGGEIHASETPLEKDGAVPMVNPNSDYADVKPSSARDKNAVRAFAYGSYENANTAAEPVRYDGRPIGYQGSDPRMGDEVGSVSRDYSRQNAARYAPDAKPLKKEGYRVVSKANPARMKPVMTGKRASYASSYSSNAVVGTIAALLFGVIACALWCGIGYLLGLMGMVDNTVRAIVMSVLGFIPALAVFLGYRIGGDCYDIKGIVIAAVVSVVCDVLGIFAVLIAGEMQTKAVEYGYSIGIDKAMENISAGFSDAARGGSLFLQIAVTAGVMLVTLFAAIVITKKKS
ncbi:MAG: hypothetical protein IJU82_02610 [Ruminiclostridium sp.]|nr:hypothetical protein [Ruminiclostridium sp.]